MNDRFALRWATPGDHAVLGEVMHDAVRNGPSRYSERQREAWVPEPRRGAEWDARLARQAIVLAEADGEVAGFMSLDPPAYVDFAYIRPAFQGAGLFRRLYDAIEARAREAGATRLSVHASLMAQPAFEAVGFTIVQAEQVELRGEMFDRFEMARTLG